MEGPGTGIRPSEMPRSGLAPRIHLSPLNRSGPLYVIRVEEFIAGRCWALSPHLASTLLLRRVRGRRGGAVRTMVACARTLGAGLAGSWDQRHDILISPGSFAFAVSMFIRGPAGPCRMPVPRPTCQARPSGPGRRREHQISRGAVPDLRAVRAVIAPKDQGRDPLTSGFAMSAGAVRTDPAGVGLAAVLPAGQRRWPWLSRGVRLRHRGPRPPPAWPGRRRSPPG
jgi:hypothetical protein